MTITPERRKRLAETLEQIYQFSGLKLQLPELAKKRAYVQRLKGRVHETESAIRDIGNGNLKVQERYEDYSYTLPESVQKTCRRAVNDRLAHLNRRLKAAKQELNIANGAFYETLYGWLRAHETSATKSTKRYLKLLIDREIEKLK